jgi:hypothetical protein
VVTFCSFVVPCVFIQIVPCTIYMVTYDSIVIFIRVLRKEGRKDGRTDGSVTISLCNSVGEGENKQHEPLKDLGRTHVLRKGNGKVIGQRSRSPGQIFRREDTPRFALPLFCVVFCRSLFILLSFYFWPLYFLSFFESCYNLGDTSYRTVIFAFILLLIFCMLSFLITTWVQTFSSWI